MDRPSYDAVERQLRDRLAAAGAVDDDAPMMIPAGWARAIVDHGWLIDAQIADLQKRVDACAVDLKGRVDELALERDRMRAALGEIRAQAHIDLRLRNAEPPARTRTTLEAIVSAVDQVLGGHGGIVPAATPPREGP